MTEEFIAQYEDDIEQETRDIAELKQNEVPAYLQMLGDIKGTNEDKLEILSIFEGGTLKKFQTYLNQEVTILGAIIYRKNAGVTKEGIEYAAYNQIRLLTDKFDADTDLPVIVALREGSLTNHIYAMIQVRGWYLWEEPVTYKFMQESSDKPFRMINVDRVKKMKAAMEARKKKNVKVTEEK